MNIDDVRKAVKRLTSPMPAAYHLARMVVCHQTDAATVARFTDAVFNPPADVAEAVRQRIGYDDSCGPDGPEFDSVIADWIVKLITPAAKETT